MIPIRIKRSREKGWKMPKNTVYVGRPGKWGNPFKVGELGPGSKYPVTNRQAVGYFREFYKGANWFTKMVRDKLKGKNLACWCSLDEYCHADVLLKMANKL